jgi:hypothetical protein
MVRFYKLDETEFSEFVDDLTEVGQPLYCYQFQDGAETYILFSNNEIDEDDLENVFSDKIRDYEIEEGLEDEEDYYDDES